MKGNSIIFINEKYSSLCVFVYTGLLYQQESINTRYLTSLNKPQRKVLSQHFIQTFIANTGCLFNMRYLVNNFYSNSSPRSTSQTQVGSSIKVNQAFSTEQMYLTTIGLGSISLGSPRPMKCLLNAIHSTLTFFTRGMK